jgi:hypothetical protein
MLRNLPKDLQRLVCLYLKTEELPKVDINFPDDDIFWSLRCQRWTDVTYPSRKRYYQMLESIEQSNNDYMRYIPFGMYETYFSKIYSWSPDIVNMLLQDETFLKKYVNYIPPKYDVSMLRYLCARPLHPKHEEYIEKLLAHGAKDVDDAMMSYCFFVDEETQEHPILRMLIKYGANVNHQEESKQYTALMDTLSVSVAKILLEHGADISLTDSRGRTALDIASAKCATYLYNFLKQASDKRLC